MAKPARTSENERSRFLQRRNRYKRVAFRSRLLRLTAIAFVFSLLLILVDSPVDPWQLHAAWGFLGFSLALGITSMIGSWVYEYRSEVRANFEADAEDHVQQANEMSDEGERAMHLREAEDLLDEGDRQGAVANRADSLASGLAIGMTAPFSAGVGMLVAFVATNFG